MRERSPYIIDTKGVIAAWHLDATRQANSGKHRIPKQDLMLRRITKPKPQAEIRAEKAQAEQAAEVAKNRMAERRRQKALKAAQEEAQDTPESAS